MEHRYYALKRVDKKKKVCGVVLKACALSAIFSAVFWALGVGFLIPVIGFLTLILLASFIDVPIMVSSRKLKYYSWMLLAEKEKDKGIRIHGGTLFDYYFTLDKHATRTQRKRFVLQKYVQGLLKLAKILDSQGKSEISIKGTSYFLQRRNLKKLGFEIVAIDPLQQILLVLNYPVLCWSQSFLEKRLVFPNLSQTTSFTHTPKGVLEHEATLQRLLLSLQ